jgi:hypothetical protein
MFSKTILLTVVLLIGLTLTAAADLTVKTKMTMDIYQAGTSETMRTDYIRSDRSYGEAIMKPISGMMAMMGSREMKTADITRIDKSLMWMLDPDKKQYHVTEFATFKEMFDSAPKKGGMAASAIGNNTNPSEYEWNVEMVESGQKGKIGKYDCTGVVAIATGVNKKDAEDKIHIRYEQWFSEDAPGYDQFMEYQKNYAKALGIDMNAEQRKATMMLGMFSDQLEEIFQKAGKIDGMLIKTLFRVDRSNVPKMKGAEDMPPQMKAMMGEPEKTDSGMFKTLAIETEIVEIVEGDTDDSKYEIPEGFKQK